MENLWQAAQTEVPNGSTNSASMTLKHSQAQSAQDAFDSFWATRQKVEKKAWARPARPAASEP